jgi:tetratricopeptide (TPR) repeat protein
MVCFRLTSCIICHMRIIEGMDKQHYCPNGHPAHQECLKEWLVQSQNCPLCNEAYPSDVLVQFQSYFRQKEKERLSELAYSLRREEQEVIQKLAEKILFKKFEESIDILIDQGEYDYALSRLEFHDKEIQSSEKGRRILFLKGKINYLKGRYDLAINQLFKLVKDQYDYPDGFFYLGKAYEALGLVDKAKWAYERVK